MFDFGQWLRDARIEHKLSQMQLAEVMGMHPVSISNLERGEQDPSFLTMISLIDYLGYEVELKKKGA